jgi:hypothetical protein
MDVVFLESGEDLEAQLRRLNLRKRHNWWIRISRKKWFVLGAIAMLLTFGCLAAAVVLASQYVVIGG